MTSSSSWPWTRALAERGLRLAEPRGVGAPPARVSEELAHLLPAAGAGADHAAARLRPRARSLHGGGDRVARPARGVHEFRRARNARVRDLHDGGLPVALRRL